MVKNQQLFGLLKNGKIFKKMFDKNGKLLDKSY